MWLFYIRFLMCLSKTVKSRLFNAVALLLCMRKRYKCKRKNERKNLTSFHRHIAPNYPTSDA